jgi:nitrogen fixation NifU-like protein
MYNDIIIDNFSDPAHVGDIDGPDYEYEIGNPVCGDRIRIQVNSRNGRIEQANFRAWGCATSVATANIFCASLEALPLEHLVDRGDSEIADMLGELEPSQHHCVDILAQLHRRLIDLLGDDCREATAGWIRIRARATSTTTPPPRYPRLSRRQCPPRYATLPTRRAGRCHPAATVN